MKTLWRVLLVLAVLSWTWAGIAQQTRDAQKVEAGKVAANFRGLHGYISYNATRPPAQSDYSAGMGFYSAVWPLIDEPIARFQIGLAGAWITPDNSDNKDTPLAPVGTLARDHWPERGPTWDSVFQTAEGGLGYWAGNHFRYGPPKFSMKPPRNATTMRSDRPGGLFSIATKPCRTIGWASLNSATDY